MTQHSLQSIVVVLALSTSACLGASGSPSEEAELDTEVDLALDSRDIKAPPGYTDADYDAVAFPLAEGDPRATIEVDPDAVLIDPGLFDPPPSPDERIAKWISSPDSRRKVVDTTVSPQSMATMLLITLDGQTSICSGTMVGKDAVLTNAHCLFNPTTQRWATNVVAVPGAYPDPAKASKYRAPFGTSSGRKLFTPTNWRLGTGNVQKGNDYGVVRTNNASFASTWRTVGYTTAPSGNIEYYGYQGDLTRYQMYKTKGPIDRWSDASNGIMQVKVSLFQGGSGSGIAASSTSNIVGVMRSTSTSFNLALLFNSTKRTQIQGWIKQAL